MVRVHHHFEIARFEFFHAAFEHDATSVDEHEIGQDVLNLFHLMRRHDDGTGAVEVIVQQRIALSAVVLPAPFGPINPRMRPSSTRRSTLSKAMVVPKTLRRSRASIHTMA